MLHFEDCKNIIMFEKRTAIYFQNFQNFPFCLWSKAGSIWSKCKQQGIPRHIFLYQMKLFLPKSRFHSFWLPRVLHCHQNKYLLLENIRQWSFTCNRTFKSLGVFKIWIIGLSFMAYKPRKQAHNQAHRNKNHLLCAIVFNWVDFVWLYRLPWP